MPLSQFQIIRSLGEALAWFEKELSWGVEPAQLNHLTGRIGELYAAMITRGQMALATNQHGYDVVSAEGEHISVKTITSSSHVTINKSTFSQVHRVIILRINVEEGEASIEEILDSSAADFLGSATDTPNAFIYRVSPARRPPIALAHLKVVNQAEYGGFSISQYENGTITVARDGVREPQAKPIIRDICAVLGVPIVNSNGNPKNTRQLGADLLAAVNSQTVTDTSAKVHASRMNAVQILARAGIGNPPVPGDELPE